MCVSDRFPLDFNRLSDPSLLRQLYPSSDLFSSVDREKKWITGFSAPADRQTMHELFASPTTTKCIAHTVSIEEPLDGPISAVLMAQVQELLSQRWKHVSENLCLSAMLSRSSIPPDIDRSVHLAPMRAEPWCLWDCIAT